MVSHPTAEKLELLLGYERDQARRLARRVFDQPRPPLWMIFIPVFFVFFAWKMKAYKSGVKSFADNWMITRERTLAAAGQAVDTRTAPQLEPLLAAAVDIPTEAVARYREWVRLLADHYCHLLQAPGTSAEALLRHHYRTRANLLLVFNRLRSVEHAYHLVLLPSLEGDREDLRATIDRILQSAGDLQREQAETIFP